MKTTHTPGPWVTEESHDIIWIGTPKNNKIDEIVVHLNNDKDYNQAVKEKIKSNAKLIAAAPELLEALIQARIIMLKSGINHENADQYNVIDKAIKKATT